MSATVELSRIPAVATRRRSRAGRGRYLLGAVCVAVATVMLLPLVVSVAASVKPTAEAAASPPTYLPHSLSLDSYQRLWTYQQGLPTYLLNSLGTALLAIAFTVALTAIGIWLAMSIADLRKTQDCVLMGRRDCAHISSPHS